MKTIPYHKLPKEKRKIRLIDGEVARFMDGRAIEVFRGEKVPGLFVRIYGPLKRGSRSLLIFRIRDEGALALASLIARKLFHKI